MRLMNNRHDHRIRWFRGILVSGKERRRETGLPSMDEYMALMEEYTNAPVVRQP